MEIKKIKKIRICLRCNNEVEVEKELDYPYFCKNCDENMYSFETKLV